MLHFFARSFARRLCSASGLGHCLRAHAVPQFNFHLCRRFFDCVHMLVSVMVAVVQSDHSGGSDSDQELLGLEERSHSPTAASGVSEGEEEEAEAEDPWAAMVAACRGGDVRVVLQLLDCEGSPVSVNDALDEVGASPTVPVSPPLSRAFNFASICEPKLLVALRLESKLKLILLWHARLDGQRLHGCLNPPSLRVPDACNTPTSPSGQLTRSPRRPCCVPLTAFGNTAVHCGRQRPSCRGAGLAGSRCLGVEVHSDWRLPPVHRQPGGGPPCSDCPAEPWGLREPGKGTLGWFNLAVFVAPAGLACNFAGAWARMQLCWCLLRAGAACLLLVAASRR